MIMFLLCLDWPRSQDLTIMSINYSSFREDEQVSNHNIQLADTVSPSNHYFLTYANKLWPLPNPEKANHQLGRVREGEKEKETVIVGKATECRVVV